MERTEKKNIEGVNYEAKEMPALKRSIIALELKQIATGLSEGIDGIDSDINYSKSIAGILDRLDPEKGAYLLMDIIMNGLRFPMMDNQEDYDRHFTEYYHHQIDLVSWIMELNFGKTINEIKKKLQTTGILSRIYSNKEEESQGT